MSCPSRYDPNPEAGFNGGGPRNCGIDVSLGEASGEDPPRPTARTCTRRIVVLREKGLLGVVQAGLTPIADRIPRWNTRPSHAATDEGEVDFGQWHKDSLSRDSYCMDVDNVEYRIDSSGGLRVVGIYELIRWGWHHDLDDIPERLAPHDGKVVLLRRLDESIAAGQRSSFPTFFVWHRPDLSEFVVCRLEDWVDGSRKATGPGREAFADLIRGLPKWEGGPATMPVQARQQPWNSHRSADDAGSPVG